MATKTITNAQKRVLDQLDRDGAVLRVSEFTPYEKNTAVTCTTYHPGTKQMYQCRASSAEALIRTGMVEKCDEERRDTGWTSFLMVSYRMTAAGRAVLYAED